MKETLGPLTFLSVQDSNTLRGLHSRGGWGSGTHCVACMRSNETTWTGHSEDLHALGNFDPSQRRRSDRDLLVRHRRVVFKADSHRHDFT